MNTKTKQLTFKELSGDFGVRLPTYLQNVERPIDELKQVIDEMKDTFSLLKEKGYSIGNIDATVCAERPKLNPHIPQMQQVLAECMGIDEDCVSIKATTTEKLGFVGRKEGIAAYCVALINRE